MKSRNLFFNLRGAMSASSVEDFVTEGFGWVLASNPAVTNTLLQSVLNKAGITGDISRASWETQVCLSNASPQRCRPDMACECTGIVFLFEHKIEEQVSAAQIETHRSLAAERYPQKAIITILITRDADKHARVADVSLSWREIQSLLRRFPLMPNAVTDLLTEQFAEFLGMEGLGRIPGPCPSYWKENILEAQRQHPAFKRGYADLGRKFGETILLATVEDEFADEGPESERDRRLFLEAFDYACSSNNPAKTIWVFCRRFFPSYVKYTDDRFGIRLQIPETQGRRFAQGIIESLQEGDLGDFFGAPHDA